MPIWLPIALILTGAVIGGTTVAYWFQQQVTQQVSQQVQQQLAQQQLTLNLQPIMQLFQVLPVILLLPLFTNILVEVTKKEVK